MIDKYSAMFDEAGDDPALTAQLGSPTKLAISLARDYVPSPVEFDEEPDEPVAEETETAPAADITPEAVEASEVRDAENAPAEETGAGPEPETETGSVFDPDAAVDPEIINALERRISGEPEPEPLPEPEQVPEAERDPSFVMEAAPAPSGGSARRVRPAALVLYIILSLVIGLPIAVVLILLGVPFLAAGLGIAVGAVYAAFSVIAVLGMISDILFVAGAALVATAVGLVVAWLGLWICLELGYLWIGKVVFRLGGKFCFKKEAPVE